MGGLLLYVSLVTQVTEPRIFSCDLCPASKAKTLWGDYLKPD